MQNQKEDKWKQSRLYKFHCSQRSKCHIGNMSRNFETSCKKHTYNIKHNNKSKHRPILDGSPYVCKSRR